MYVCMQHTTIFLYELFKKKNYDTISPPPPFPQKKTQGDEAS